MVSARTVACVLFFLAIQTASASPPERISILVPVANEPCRRTEQPATDTDILVCAQRLPAQKLPLPQEATSPLPQPVNRDMTGMGALRAEGTPCAARIGGCQTGVDVFGAGTSVIRGIQKLVAPDSCCEEPGEATNAGKLVSDAGAGIARLFRKRPDKSRRVAIPLDDPPPTGRVLP